MDIENVFTYHPPTPNQIPKYDEIRKAAKIFAKVIQDQVPEGPDKSVVMRKLREAVMTANAAVALEGKL